jgi:ankyrin repeat protein
MWKCSSCRDSTERRSCNQDNTAVRAKQPELLQVITNAGADVSAADGSGRTALHVAVDRRCHTSLVLLLQAYAQVHAADTGLLTSVMRHAVTAGNMPAVEHLLSAGASCVDADDAGDTPMLLAARLGCADIVRQLLAAGAQLGAAAGGRTALHHAAALGCTTVVQLLIAEGADVNAPLATQDTALHLAVKSTHTATVEVLLDAAAAVYTPGSDGGTALCMAAMTGHSPTMECLLQHRCLSAAAAADDMVRSAAAAAQTNSLDARTKQRVVLQLLLPAVRNNTEAAKAALELFLQPAGGVGSTLASAMIDAWIESDAMTTGLDKQRAGVQHLIVSMAAAHKEQQAELKHARLSCNQTCRAQCRSCWLQSEASFTSRKTAS